MNFLEQCGKKNLILSNLIPRDALMAIYIADIEIEREKIYI